MPIYCSNNPHCRHARIIQSYSPYAPLSNTLLLDPHQSALLNVILIGSANCWTHGHDQHTQTERLFHIGTSVAIAHL